MKIILIFCCLFAIPLNAELEISLTNRRNKIIENELKMSMGGNIMLNHKETLVNEILMQWKVQELDKPDKFMFSRNFFEYRDDLKNSRVYQFIKEMPKGAALHVHASAMLGPDYFLNITYKDHLYVCLGNTLMFKFAYEAPADDCEAKWRLISDVRKSLDNVTKFDMELRNNFTLEGTDKDANSIWLSFGSFFKSISNLWTYRPVWEEYIYEVMNQSREDKVMYIEIRSFLPQLYELDGRRHNELFFTNITNRVVDKFIRDYPDFLGAKIICSFGRKNDPKTVEELLSMTKESKRVFPDFVAGFDLIGREDMGRPLLDFLPQLEAAEADLDYFFHAGETNWYGTSTDQNLIDAVLLGTKRIGHAYALLKHPLVLEEVKRKQIGLEVSLVSNNVLGYVGDMRNHPMASFIAQGLPVVVSSDDPGLWGAAPLTTDFYVAFMGVASRAHDLRLLKQLALNSIQYSSLSPNKKETAFKMFDDQWKRFILQEITNRQELSAQNIL